jgi:hypothetical protein
MNEVATIKDIEMDDLKQYVTYSGSHIIGCFRIELEFPNLFGASVIWGNPLLLGKGYEVGVLLLGELCGSDVIQHITAEEAKKLVLKIKALPKDAHTSEIDKMLDEFCNEIR